MLNNIGKVEREIMLARNVTTTTTDEKHREEKTNGKTTRNKVIWTRADIKFVR